MPWQEAEDLLNTTAKPHSSRRRRRDKDARLLEGAATDVAANGVVPADGGNVAASLAAAEADAVAAGAVPPSAEGGWGEDMDVEGGGDGDIDNAAAKFKPGIKFKLAS